MARDVYGGGGGKVEGSEKEKRRRKWFKEREERIRRKRRLGEEEAERKLEEERKKRERNMIWRRVEGDDEEKRLWLVEEIVKRTLGREVGIRGVVEKRGEGERWILIMEMEKVRDKEEILEKEVEIGRLWRVEVDEDLTMEERRRRWKIVEAARRKRARGRRVELNNREMWVEGRRWVWRRESGSWVDEEEV